MWNLMTTKKYICSCCQRQQDFSLPVLFLDTNKQKYLDIPKCTRSKLTQILKSVALKHFKKETTREQWISLSAVRLNRLLYKLVLGRKNINRILYDIYSITYVTKVPLSIYHHSQCSQFKMCLDCKSSGTGLVFYLYLNSLQHNQGPSLFWFKY